MGDVGIRIKPPADAQQFVIAYDCSRSGRETLKQPELAIRHGNTRSSPEDVMFLGFAAAFAAASGASLIQYFLTGGPVAALATVIPVIPGSDLKGANAFQRPSILFGCLVAFLITFCLNLL